MNWSRRDFISVGLGTAGTLLLPRAPLWASEVTPEPHFFLQIFVPFGMDNSYLFDSRPLAMTAAGKIQNYLGEDPIVFSPVNGGKSLRTSLTNDLVRKFGDKFSVINGVLMSASFDGHNQNTNFLFAGDPTGGESFIPHLNQGNLAHAPLDAIQAGTFFASLTNTQSTVPLTASAAKGLIDRLKSMPPIRPQDPLSAFIRKRYEAIAQGNGIFSTSAQALMEGYDGAPSLANMFKGIGLPTPPQTGVDAFDLDHFPQLVMELFKSQACRSAILSFQPPIAMNTTATVPTTFDTHDSGSCKAQPQLFGTLMNRVVSIFQALQDTPFDATRSFWDVTTVMVTSEFGRTMRQEGVDIAKTGTDHNPLNNSVIIGGKGIRPGMVIGASDQVLADPNEKLSGAHLLFDPKKLKIMGRPFDFATMQPRTDLPATYVATDYLQCASVANTIYSLFGVDTKKYRLVERNGKVAPVLTGLLS